MIPTFAPVDLPMSSIPPPGHSHPRGTPPLGSGSPRPAVAVHLQYMHVVGEPVQQRAPVRRSEPNTSVHSSKGRLVVTRMEPRS